MLPKTKPKNVEPASPMNIEAGYLLYGRKPKHEPAIAAATMARFVSPVKIATEKRDIAEIAETAYI